MRRRGQSRCQQDDEDTDWHDERRGCVAKTSVVGCRHPGNDNTHAGAGIEPPFNQTVRVLLLQTRKKLHDALGSGVCYAVLPSTHSINKVVVPPAPK